MAPPNKEEHIAKLSQAVDPAVGLKKLEATDLTRDLVQKMHRILDPEAKSFEDIPLGNSTLIVLDGYKSEEYSTLLARFARQIIGVNKYTLSKRLLDLLEQGTEFSEAVRSVREEAALRVLAFDNITKEDALQIADILGAKDKDITTLPTNDKREIKLAGTRPTNFQNILSHISNTLFANQFERGFARMYLNYLAQGMSSQEASEKTQELHAQKQETKLHEEHLKEFSIETLDHILVQKLKGHLDPHAKSIEEIPTKDRTPLHLDGYKLDTFRNILIRLARSIFNNADLTAGARRYLGLIETGVLPRDAQQQVFMEQEKEERLLDPSIANLDRQAVIDMRCVLDPLATSIRDVSTKSKVQLHIPRFKSIGFFKNVLARISNSLWNDQHHLVPSREYLALLEEGIEPAKAREVMMLTENAQPSAVKTEDTKDERVISSKAPRKKEAGTNNFGKQKDIEDALKKLPLKKGALVDLMDGVDTLLFAPIDIKERKEGVSSSHAVISSDTDSGPNALQDLRYKMSHAIRSEQWDEVTLLYLEYYTYLPAFVEHLLGVRYLVETLGFVPNNVLSIASGPLEEEFAWYMYLIGTGKVSQLPTVYNVDISGLMLDLGRDALLPRLQEKYPSIPAHIWDRFGVKEKNHVGDMRSFDALLADAPSRFDLIECSSIDNLGEEELLPFFEKAHDHLMEGGYVKIVDRHAIPVLVKKFLSERGYIFHDTAADKLYIEAPSATPDQGRLAERMKQKLRRSHILIARKPSGSDSLRSNFTLRLHMRERDSDFYSERLKSINEVVQAYIDEKGGIEALTKEDMGYLNDELKKYSYTVVKDVRRAMLVYRKV